MLYSFFKSSNPPHFHLIHGFDLYIMYQMIDIESEIRSFSQIFYVFAFCGGISGLNLWIQIENCLGD